MATLATAWREAGELVAVVTGPATSGIVADFGFDGADLVLGCGRIPGSSASNSSHPGEDAALRGFFAATRHGMVATLRYQAEARRTDLCGSRWTGPGPSSMSSTGSGPTT